MTKTAKLDAPTVSLDRPIAALRPASVDQPARPHQEPASPQIDNALVAELESALQAVVARSPRPQPLETVEAETAPPSDTIQEEPASQGVWYGPDAEASEPAGAPYLLLRPAETAEPPRAPSFDLQPAPEDRRPGADAPRRRGLPLRAALCVAGLLGLAGAGGAGLMIAAPGEAPAPPPAESAPAQMPADEPVASPAEPVAPVARQVRTETIRVPADAQQAAQNDAAGAAGAPAPAAAAETPAGEVTLLRPVGDSRSAESGVIAQPQEPAETDTPVKTPDRLAETAAPVDSAPAAEAPDGGSSGDAVEMSAGASPVRVIDPAGGAAERLPSEADRAAGEALVATVPTPLDEEELVARSGAEGDEGASAATAGQPDGTLQPQDLEAGDGAEPGQAADSGGPTRSAPVTSAVNMRAAPGNDAAVLTVVPAGSEVEVIGCEFWCEVVFGGERGWIYRSFVSGAQS